MIDVDNNNEQGRGTYTSRTGVFPFRFNCTSTVFNLFEVLHPTENFKTDEMITERRNTVRNGKVPFVIWIDKLTNFRQT